LDRCLANLLAIHLSPEAALEIFDEYFLAVADDLKMTAADALVRQDQLAGRFSADDERPMLDSYRHRRIGSGYDFNPIQITHEVSSSCEQGRVDPDRCRQLRVTVIF
jgi:hypothetical protein